MRGNSRWPATLRCIANTLLSRAYAASNNSETDLVRALSGPETTSPTSARKARRNLTGMVDVAVIA